MIGTASAPSVRNSRSTGRCDIGASESRGRDDAILHRRVNGSWREFHECWEGLHRDDLRLLNLLADAFADEFNTCRPHDAQSGPTPAEYLRQSAAAETPRPKCPEPG